jgi:hypothetical protein
MKMNKNVLLATVAATALIAGASLALAQSANTEQPKAAAPMKSVSEKPGQPARNSNKDADKAQTTGQAPQADDASKAKDGKKAQAPKPQTTGQAPKADDTKKAEDTKKAPRQTTGQAPREGQAQQPQAQPGQSGTQSGTQPGQPGQAGGGVRPDAQPGQSGAQSGTQGRAGQAGQAGAGGLALSTEQRTQIRQTVMNVGNAPRVSNVAFSLSVGTVVPRSVKYAPLPARVVEIYPAWRSYQFFIVGDQIVVVEPDSLRIVAVLPA